MSGRVGAGHRLGRYEIISWLGAGGMGEVFKANDTRLNRAVAIKVLPPGFVTDRNAKARFEREAQAVAALNHPHICAIYDIGRDDDVDYLVMELVDGETLASRIARGALPLADALHAAREIADALESAHEAGIIHRDLKPANIMLTRSGAKLLDFGVARLVQDVPDATQTAAGTVLGTPAYMSPEQAEGDPLDGRSDVFSIGAVLYEMIDGRPPFRGASTAQVLSAVLRDEPPPVSAPAPIQQIITRCLVKQRENRFPTMTALRTALDEVTVAPPAPTRSIAVLPFANVSADPTNEYFCDGLAEELLNALTKIHELKVAARTSAFSFKGKKVTIADVGKALNVNTVLEGSVRKVDNRVRITVQLVDVLDGFQIWSERYDRRIEDIFDVQDEIAAAVVSALKVELFRSDQAPLVKRYTDNAAAYELYLKGRYETNKYTASGWRSATEQFDSALRLEPMYAPAYAALAACHLYLWYFGFLPSDVAIPKCSVAARRALAIDADLAEAHLALANVRFFYEWDWEYAEQEYRRTIEIDPKSADAHSFYGLFLVSRGRFGDAVREGRLALGLDPRSLVVNMNVGWIFWSADLRADALAQVSTMIDIDPAFYGAYWLQGAVYLTDGRYDAAISALERAIALGGPRIVLADLGAAYGMAGDRQPALTVLQQLLEARAREYVPAIYIARVHSGLGHNDEAFEWLEKAYQERNGELVFLKKETQEGTGDPMGGGFGADPRLGELLGRIGLA